MLEVHNLHAATARAKCCTGSICRRAPARSWCVVGRNGMGKSTLMKSLIGMVPVRTGQIASTAPTSPAAELQRVAQGSPTCRRGGMIFRP